MDQPRRIGSYTLHGVIASGGMAEVRFARAEGALGFARVVAAKRLAETYANDPALRPVLLDEARLVSRIRHANVVSVLDVVEDDASLVLVMEYVPGETLARLARAMRKRGEPVDPAIAVAILVGVLEGLQAAHDATDEEGRALAVVHRDVSPQNVIVGTDGIARVLDFGIAKALGRIQSTSHGEVKGKAAYMAPEQLRGAEIDRRVDVFAAGIVLWELLAGRRLFEADSPAASMMRVLESELEPPGVSPELDAVVMKALARDRDARFATAKAMAEALERACPPAPAKRVAEWVLAAAGDAIAARAKIVDELEAAGPDPAPPVAAAPAPRTTPRWPLAAGGVVVFLLVVVVLALPRPDARAPVAAADAMPLEMAASASAPDPPPPSSVEPRPTARVVRPRSPIRRPAPHRDCNPPYTVDSAGIHVMKPECL